MKDAGIHAVELQQRRPSHAAGGEMAPDRIADKHHLVGTAQHGPGDKPICQSHDPPHHGTGKCNLCHMLDQDHRLALHFATPSPRWTCNTGHRGSPRHRRSLWRTHRRAMPRGPGIGMGSPVNASAGLMQGRPAIPLLADERGIARARCPAHGVSLRGKMVAHLRGNALDAAPMARIEMGNDKKAHQGSNAIGRVRGGQMVNISDQGARQEGWLLYKGALARMPSPSRRARRGLARMAHCCAEKA